MKGIICYFSGSGNTQLACRYIAGKMKNIGFDLFDIFKIQGAGHYPKSINHLKEKLKA